MIIYFSAQLPSRRVPVAGQKIAWNNLKDLADPKDLILFSFINNIEKPFFKKSDYNGYKKTYFYFVSKSARLRNCIKNIFYPLKVSGRYSDIIFEKLKNEVESNDIKKIFFEFTSSMLYAKKIKEIFPHLEIHFVEHDVTYQSYKRLINSKNLFNKLFYFFEYNRMKYFEVKVLKKLDFVYTLNSKDLQLLKENNITNVSIKYPRVEDWIYNVNRNNIEKYSILFLGAMHRNENKQAVKWFVINIIPKLISIFPNLKFYVVGGGVSESIKKLQNKNVVITGYVENLEHFFEKAQVAVVPLSYGAGIKIKTVETISAKITTIASKIGAEGVDKNEFLKIANSKEEFVELIKKEFSNV